MSPTASHRTVTPDRIRPLREGACCALKGLPWSKEWGHRGKWLWELTGGHCAYCGDPFPTPREMTEDHVVPRSRGGDSSRANRLPSCNPCNATKGNRPLSYLREVLRRRRDGVPYFTPKQLSYLLSCGFVLPRGEPLQFYWEVIGNSFPVGA